jgi:hypothetical protein
MSFDTPTSQLSWLADESARARRLSVRVYASGRVEVVRPRGVSERAVRAFVQRHRDWIERRRAAALRERPPPAAFPPPSIELPAFDETWRLHLAGGRSPVRVIARAGGLLEVRGEIESPDRLAHALQRWVMQHVREPLARQLAALSAETGLAFSRLTVRRQRTRWGSCSVRGVISVNACVAFQPPAVVRYLLLHELVHTRHMNHSARFWRAVAEHVPRWRELDRQLLAGWRHVPAWMFGAER